MKTLIFYSILSLLISATVSDTCDNISWNETSGMGFDQTFYDKMYTYFDANINIQGKGGIVAAPDYNTPGGSYYYHWMRDAALTMRTYLQINDMNLSIVQTKMKSYVDWVKRVQNQTDPNGFDIRINPKFQLPNGQAFSSPWCRPQTDGPGLRSATMITIAQLLLDYGQSGYVLSNILPAIKYDLSWVINNWNSNGCDLWQEVRSTDFYWNKASYVYSLDLCTKLFRRYGDTSMVNSCLAAKTTIQNSLNGHWTGDYISEADIRPRDSAVIHAFSSFDVISLTDDKVAKTIKILTSAFCLEYQINQQDLQNGQPGVLVGRYPGDTYAGGNPWQLLSAVLAKIFYQGASVALSSGFQNIQDKNSWYDILGLANNSSSIQFSQAAMNAGDAVMNKIYKYVKNDGGHISEQIDKVSGVQISAKDLTWSYANILSTMKYRNKVVEQINKIQQLQQQ